mgnify:CR=1 FL=1
MKLKSDADTISFLNAVKACAGEVYFVTSEGDRLNLKSILSCYLLSEKKSDTRQKRLW